MGLALPVTDSNFAAAVLASSHNQVVVVDFFAQWCGPCKLLKPLLERLANEYNFALALIDIDQSPELASRYQVAGVPDVRICSQGELKPGFVGALTEPQLREFLGEQGLHSQVETALETIRQQRVAGNTEAVKQHFGQLIERYPNHPHLILAAAEFLIQIDSLASAQKLLGVIPIDNRPAYDRSQTLRALIELKQQFQALTLASDVDQQYLEALAAMFKGDYESALELLLGSIERNRKSKPDAARKAMIVIFGLLGNDHLLTSQYRKRLMLSLY